MKTFIVFFLNSILLRGSLCAQNILLEESGIKNVKKNAINFEVLGNAAVWPVNYYRQGMNGNFEVVKSGYP